MRGRLLQRAAGTRPGLFASQRRGRAGQRSERRQQTAYFFALLGQVASPCLL
ncbi:hypothetical protein [Paenibacillus kribbensis]|uniref:hypothetical protein n=1 Tax=Paenibacillus kribbensis TaxID=172713 RepID=UPI000AC499AF|nr:hypothetical protein [Paenibacillus kribbensis]